MIKFVIKFYSYDFKITRIIKFRVPDNKQVCIKNINNREISISITTIIIKYYIT